MAIFDNFTASQKAAVRENGNVLVAAAAGSGKTAVLVERVIKHLCSEENHISADRLLIVTVTNAAAAEMRSRIEKRLDEECLKNPGNAHLILQKHLIANAKICTIDSFCIDMVRENFDKAGVSPDFKIDDGYELSIIRDNCINAIIKRYLKDDSAAFSELMDLAGCEYNETPLSNLILSLYEYSRQLPFPKYWFKKLPDSYENGQFTKNNEWYKYSINVALKTAEESLKILANAIDILAGDENAYNKYRDCFTLAADRLNFLSSVAQSSDWDGIYNELQVFNLPSLPQLARGTATPESILAKSIYDDIKAGVPKKLNKLFYADIGFISSQFSKIYPSVKLLSEIMIEFEDAVFEGYREKNIFTFHNTEHLALNMLCNEVDGEAEIKPEAYEFLDRFDEICVDEYQDTNDLQNMLFKALSNYEKKLFTVGDVKQSIYGFRGANPENFLNKKNSYIPLANAKENDPKKIILSNNFRSKAAVCDFINYFFRLFMNENTGKIIYNDEEKLDPKAVFPQSSFPAVSIDFIETADAEENDAKVLEARQIASFIKKTMSSGEVIRESENTLRKARFSDFAILLRSIKTYGSPFVTELRRQGIPVEYSADSFLENTEVAVVLSLLKIIDNPTNDAELLSVMMSPIFGFSAEELAKMRIEKRDGNIYSAVTSSAVNGNEKASEFLATISRFRLYSLTNTIDNLIDILLTETGYLDTVSAYEDGNRRRNNLLLLCNYAAEYSQGQSANISSFLRYIENFERTGNSSNITSGNNAVKIMTIHASKGLQFPVCIVAATSKKFGNFDAQNSIVYSTKFGIGFKYYDELLKERYTTIGRECILDRISKIDLEEEMRLFYVAMTRTQDILHFTSVVSDFDKKISAISSNLQAFGSQISQGFIEHTNSYSDWLTAALLLNPECVNLRPADASVIAADSGAEIYVSRIHGDAIENNIQINETGDSDTLDGLVSALKENIGYEYPYKDLMHIQSKASVSVLANSAESEKHAFSDVPPFMNGNILTGAQYGTAMHKCLQFFNFNKWQTPEEELERLEEHQFLSESEIDSLNLFKLKQFFASDIFKRILNAKNYKKEMRFLTEIPVSRVAPQLADRFKDEKIIVQGAVDVCFIEDDGIVILDFKTDRTDSMESLKDAYSEQLNIYAEACAKIFNMPVKEKVIYSFSLGDTINV